MSYQAYGCGYLEIKDKSGLDKKLQEEYNIKLTAFYQYNDKNGLMLSYSENDNCCNVCHENDNYHTEEIFKFMNDVMPFLNTENSYIEFVGEDNEKWIVTFKNQKVEEFSGITVYPEYDLAELSNEILIKEVKKRKLKINDKE